MRSYSAAEFDLPSILNLKGQTTISVCIPALNEAATIGKVVEVVAGLAAHGAIDEFLVIDSGSEDRTAEIATAAGATVIHDREVLASMPPASGKGEAMWKGLLVASGDIVCWVDADIANFHGGFVMGLSGPLLADPLTQFVKSYYRRPLIRESSDPLIGEGGRVTELTAKPLLRLLFPELAALRQPISGEYAARRELVESIPFETGYGVDIGILIDVWRHVGADAITEVDLDVRFHRNRPLDELGSMADQVAAAILRRAGIAAPFTERPPISSIDSATRAGLRTATRAGLTAATRAGLTTATRADLRVDGEV